MENQENTNYESTDFQHGFTSGLESVDRDTYERYLSSQVNFDWLTARIAEKKEEQQAISGQIESIQQQLSEAFNSLQGHLLNVGVVGKVFDRTKTQVTENQEEINSIQARIQQSLHQYSLMAGLLYLVAGVSFLLGDLIISHEIVAYALNIRDNTEAWAFAFGLAMVSVLLKPAYERLIETPYNEKKTERSRIIYVWFKGILIVFSVATLFILGWFRYEAYKTDKLKQAVNQSIKSLQQQSIDPINPSIAPSAAVQQQMDTQLKNYQILNEKLVNSPWALASFVLSGILFALAGAVCLGIAFPVMQCYWSRWLQLKPALKRLKKEKKLLVSELSATEQALAEHIKAQQILENQLQHLPDTTQLEKVKASLIQAIDELQEKARLAQTDSRIAAFDDGYAKGDNTREWMSDDEYYQFKSSYFTTANLAAKAKASADKSFFAKKNVRTPAHEALRRRISEDLGGE